MCVIILYSYFYLIVSPHIELLSIFQKTPFIDFIQKWQYDFHMYIYFFLDLYQ